MTAYGSYPLTRLRRLRKQAFTRNLVRETQLSVQNLIAPFFVQEGENQITPIASMPGIARYTTDRLLEIASMCHSKGIPAIALFPVIPLEQKSLMAEEAFNPDGLIPRTVRLLKQQLPTLGIICDVALDPYTSHGQDGIIDETGYVLNDETISALVKQALTQAASGADILAPSDMMDGRILAIRTALEAQGFHDTCLLSYAVKYASSFYGPFRDAVGAKTLLGKADKKTYQMDPANTEEALREVALDLQEGADIIMVKPGMPYLDVLWRVKQRFQVPTFAYQVSGEYSMLQTAVNNGHLPPEAIIESLLCLRRGGADAIFTYFAPWLVSNGHVN